MDIISGPIEHLGHIGVLMGGCSSEREISLRSGEAIFAALNRAGCRVSKMDITTEKELTIVQQLQDNRIDVAFIALHGRLGEDGRIQAILEGLRIPYTGSGVEASQKALNKITAQKLLKAEAVPVADHLAFSRDQALSDEEVWQFFDGKNFIVKPACEGSSIGVTIVRRKEDIREAIARAFEYGPEILLERFIQGRELTVGILGDEPLPVIEIKPKATFFDFEAKYQSATTEYEIPAKISGQLSSQLQTIALKAYQTLGCRHFGRVDIILDDENHPFVLEINTIPGFTNTSLLPKAAALRGMNFTQLCLRLVSFAYEKEE